jgi:hypothetical protein
MRPVPFAALLALAAASSTAARAEEGMWLVNDFPADLVEKTYGFRPSPRWLEHVQRSSARIAGGCSASFVSGQGLALTNHHCIRDCIEDLSTRSRDLLAQGFAARTQADERRCPKLELNQLVEIADVTARVNAATAALQGAAFNTALKAEMTRIESGCGTADDVRCEVVTLFHGGQYHLYRYQRFQDVRLVFAPEFQMAAFGGYPDNFSFPRYGHDFAFVRAYVQDAPAPTPHHFRWAAQPARDGDLTFVAGHPGGTDRKQPVAVLRFQRDVATPWSLLRLSELRGMLAEFQKRSPEHQRVVKNRLRAVENGHKALRGRHEFLASPTFFAAREREEAELRAAVAKDPGLQAEVGGAWMAIEAALEAHRAIYPRYQLAEGGEAFSSELFTMARQLVRAAEELPKPNTERLREYTDARLPGLKQALVRPAPISADLEEALLAFSLSKAREILGVDDPFVREALDGKTPEAAARAAVRGTKLFDAEARRALLEGGAAAVGASKDPMIALARRVDVRARALRKDYEDRIESVLKRNGELIARATVAVRGQAGYPDATFTLRVSYGQVKGLTEGEVPVPPLTRLSGLFARHTGEPWFTVSAPWLAARAKVDPETPVNLATTHDIIGGNSGSPLINREGEVVGVIFDSNLAGLGSRYGYDPARSRAVSVHGSLILTALSQVYGASRVAAELQGH